MVNIYIYMCVCVYVCVCMHAMGYYSAIKKEILLFVTVLIDSEGIILCKLNKTEMNNFCMILLINEI